MQRNLEIMKAANNVIKSLNLRLIRKKYGIKFFGYGESQNYVSRRVVVTERFPARTRKSIVDIHFVTIVTFQN